jgi:hypothetical protein
VKIINKQLDFGTAVGLTETQTRPDRRFSVPFGAILLCGARGLTRQINRFGIKVKPATKTDLVAAVQTNADWLIPHEEGTENADKRQNIAVPTDQVRRNKRLIIPRGQRPKGLNTKAFVMQTKHGPVLAQRIKRGPRKGIIVLYGLERSVHIKKVSTFHDPIEKEVNRFLTHDIAEGIEFALKTAK